MRRPTAEVVNVGKRCGPKSITQEEINALMIDHARAGRSVVRLKSGDPLIFGRAAEEMAALNDAGMVFRLSPESPQPLPPPPQSGCSLTDRNSASNVIFSTGHHAQSHNQSPLPEIEDATRVVYMPGRNLTLLAAEWLDKGYRQTSPASSSPTPRSPTRKCDVQLSPPSAKPNPRSRPACSSPAGPFARPPRTFLRRLTAFKSQHKLQIQFSENDHTRTKGRATPARHLSRYLRRRAFAHIGAARALQPDPACEVVGAADSQRDVQLRN